MIKSDSMVVSGVQSNPNTEEKSLVLMPHTPKWEKRKAQKVQSINMPLAVARRDRNGLSIKVMGQDALGELIVRYDPFHRNVQFELTDVKPVLKELEDILATHPLF